MKKYKCENCGALNKIPGGVSPSASPCESCSWPLTNAKEQAGDPSATAVGVIGGAALGAYFAGSPGAVLGGIIGAFIGKGARGV
uniref:Uncharacterized protein n=1 Tax=Candidatus Kentrum sp. LFY TaxID=2126342 RepID=A0A450U9M5_9GAMM|nr:MAG: hypothetical protein BECKLFY1418A_GA0070994_100541 [Candidatus Kentron sp. LFY]